MSDDRPEEALIYHPSKVSWVTAEFLRRPPLWMASAFVSALAVTLVVMLVYAGFAEVAIHIDARGVLMTDPPILPLLVPQGLTVAKLNVREQQVVKKGDVLITAVAEEDGSAAGGEPSARRSSAGVVAPVSGVVHHLAVSGEGQLIPAGTEVLEIIPENAKLVAQVAVANKDITQIRSGLPVMIRLDAFPERTYGTISGIVAMVPLSATSVDASSPPMFMVTVELDRQSLSRSGEMHPFRIGMQLEARVVTHHESMLSSALRKLFSISDDV